MKRISSLHRFLICLAAALTATLLPACGGSDSDDIRAARRVLAVADTLLLTHPEAAIDSLATLPDSIADPATAAWRDLLTVKARDKAYITLRDYSTEQRAYNYYIGSNDSLEYQSAYYFGLMLAYCGRNDSALIVQTEALELAHNQGDKFYAGMAAGALSEVYGNLLIANKAYDYAVEAKKYFIDAGRPVHATWQELMIIRGLYLQRHFDKAIETIDSIESTGISNDTFRDLLNDKKVTLFNISGNHEQLAATFDEMIRSGHEMTSHDWCLLTNSLIHLGKWSEAQSALKNVDDRRLSRRDSVYSKLLQAKILASKGDYNNAYQLAIDGGAALSSLNVNKLLQPENQLLSDYLNLKANTKEKEAETASKNNIRTIIFSSIIILMLTGLLYTLYKKKKANETIFRLKEIALLSTLRDKDTLLDTRRAEFDKERKELNLTIEELKLVISRIKNANAADSDSIAIFNDLCNRWYSYINCSAKNQSAESQDKRFIKQLTKELSKLNDPKFLDHQVELKDLDNNYQLSMLRIILPDISDNDYKLLAYSYIGFDAAAIAALLGHASTNSVYQSKHRIKIKIVDSGHRFAPEFIKTVWGE